MRIQERLLKMASGTIAIIAGIFTSSAALAALTFSNATTSLTVNGGEAKNGRVPVDGYFR